MGATLYCEILTKTLLPFLAEKFPTPNSHRFMQDNDPKQCHINCDPKSGDSVNKLFGSRFDDSS